MMTERQTGGRNFVQNVDGVTDLNLCTSSNDAVYLNQIL